MQGRHTDYSDSFSSPPRWPSQKQTQSQSQPQQPHFHDEFAPPSPALSRHQLSSSHNNNNHNNHSISSPSYSAAPLLTPNPSSQSLYSTPPPAELSSLDSSPVFSTINSPADDFFPPSSILFDPATGCSMTEDLHNLTAYRSSSGASSIKPFYRADSGAFDGDDHHQVLDGDSMYLHSGLPFDYLESEDYSSLLSPVKINIDDTQPNFFHQYRPAYNYHHQQQHHHHEQEHRRASSVSSAPNTTSCSPTHVGGVQPPRSFSSTPARHPLTPEHTPVQGPFLAPPFNPYEASPRNADVSKPEVAMRRSLLEQHNQQQTQQHQPLPQFRSQSGTGNESPYHYSFAPSVSTVTTSSPATPQTNYADDELPRGVAHDLNSTGTPAGNTKLTRTVSDNYGDELYNPAMSAVAQSHSQPHANGKSYHHFQNLINDRLQAAHQGHMVANAQNSRASPRQNSPFRQGSPFAAAATAYHSAHLQQPSQLSSEMQPSGLRGMAMMNGSQEPKTISPKEALLEYHESPDDSGLPLFPSQAEPSSQYNVAAPTNIGGGQNYLAGIDQYAQNQQSTQQYYLQQRALQQRLQQQPPAVSQQPQQLPQTTVGQNQRLPAPFSNAAPLRDRQKEFDVVRRPQDTSSDAGTYSCTYHGCTLRFDSPARLQKHKREAHRQTTPSSQVLLRDASGGAAASLRNSQAGPHKCERINPSTGKPCNSIFSRPYDLTRHEDTIHNARKQKVRCQLCQEEKTFSRNDALTRHMRVVHPEVSWPGKQKRKGRE